MNRNGDHIGRAACEVTFPCLVFEEVSRPKIPCWWPGTDGGSTRKDVTETSPKTPCKIFHGRPPKMRRMIVWNRTFDFQLWEIFLSPNIKKDPDLVQWWTMIRNGASDHLTLILSVLTFRSYQRCDFFPTFSTQILSLQLFSRRLFPPKKNPTVFGRFGWKGGTRWYLWDDWAVSSWPWWNCCFRDEKLHIRNTKWDRDWSHGKDSHEPTSIKECHMYIYIWICIHIGVESNVAQV